MQVRLSLITFSHLRWDFVYQRPQHLLSRWAQDHRVIFIEEPVFDPSAPAHWERQNPLPNILVLRPHTPVASPGFSAPQIPWIRELLHELLTQEKIDEYVCWFYTPMALALVEDLRPLAVVYDCMDELSAFLNAPPELLRSEEHLLQDGRSRLHRRTESLPGQEGPASERPLLPEQRGRDAISSPRKPGLRKRPTRSRCRIRASVSSA